MAEAARFALAGLGALAGFLGFLLLDGIGAVLALVGGTLLGGVIGHLVFKRLATPEQIKQDLRERTDSVD
ncbi:hypothetical protein [Boseongicola sp. H5]|uniref:hypothetical protein n=1 Tax=Boseongicola sp. H5 TaxID=2763261 RepID=UPI001D0A77CF|nr:hypothetical protein [Boseongicola sp. H5]